MTTRLENNPHSNQENAVARLVGKSTVISKASISRRGALGDLGNKIHNLQKRNESIKGNVMGPPGALAKKNIDIIKKPPAVTNKDNGVKTDKENLVKAYSKKPAREESILQRSNQQVKKKVSESVNKLAIAEQTKDLVIYDPDENTKDDPQMVTEYIHDIVCYLKSIEDEFPIKEKFLEDSKVTPKMRSTLVNWLVEVHRNFTMGLEALHLCVSVVDRYIQVEKAVDRNTYQLVGTSAMLLAAKYEEVYIPDLEDFAFICDFAFTKKQILKMEMEIFRKLDFRLGWPLSICFLRRYSKIASVKAEQHTLAKYILELALLEYNLASIKPSVQAAAACCLSMAVLNETMDPSRVWTPTLVHYTKHKYSEFKSVVYEFAQTIAKAETSKFDAVRQKYSTAKFSKISLNFKLQGPLIRKLSSPMLNRK